MVERQSVRREFAKYVSLNILGQAAYSCYTLADTFMVAADMGADGLTALNLAFPMFCLISATGLMIGIGGGTRYSICKGGGQDAKANRAFTSAALLACAFALFYFLAGLFFSEPLAQLLGADDAMTPMTNTYLRVMMLFAPAFLCNHLLQCFVRNDGAPDRSMAALISGSVSNIVLDYVFIFPLRMGIFGAILATGLAPVISILVISPYLLQRRNHFRFAGDFPHLRTVREVLSTGFPPFLAEAASGMVMFVFNFIILRLAGNVGVAAFSVITVVSLVVIAIYTGLSQGIQPIISRNYGAGNRANVNAVLRYAMGLMLAISAVIYAVIFFGTEPITAAFDGEGNGTLRAFAVPGMRLYFIACPFVGFNIVLSTYFISTERAPAAQGIMLLRSLFILIPMVFLLSTLLNMTGVWCAYPVTECIVALIGLMCYCVMRRRGELGRVP